MKICVITYNAPHKKTSDVVLNLHSMGRYSIDFMVFPFSKRPERSVLFEHRPFQFEGPPLKSLARLVNAEIFDCKDSLRLIEEFDYFIVCGAGLLEENFANSGKVLNCHPGLLPVARGLDALKWAIYNETPVGNTLHLIDSGVDAGRTLAHLKTPIFSDDTIESFAARHYAGEIYMLSNFEYFINNGDILDLSSIGAREPTKRMKSDIEKLMLDRFERSFRELFSI